MNEAAIDRVIASGEALIAALDAHDLDALEAAFPDFGDKVKLLKSASGWAGTPQMRDRLRRAMEIADAARTRVRYLTDHNRQRIDLLSQAAGRLDCAPIAYSRPR